MKIAVLLADDNAMMRKAIARLLQSYPQIELVAEATSFSQMMQLVKTTHPQVVIMDLHMGDERNVSPPQVKSCLAACRLLAISIWNDDEAKALAESFGACALLDKTKLATELIRGIEEYADPL